jgi:hypothetical protein
MRGEKYLLMLGGTVLKACGDDAPGIFHVLASLNRETTPRGGTFYNLFINFLILDLLFRTFL